MLFCCIALPPRPTDFDTQSLMSNLSSLGVLSSLPILCPAKKLLPESQGLPWVVCPWPTARHRGRGCCAQLSRSRSSVTERTLNPTGSFLKKTQQAHTDTACWPISNRTRSLTKLKYHVRCIKPVNTSIPPGMVRPFPCGYPSQADGCSFSLCGCQGVYIWGGYCLVAVCVCLVLLLFSAGVGLQSPAALGLCCSGSQSLVALGSTSGVLDSIVLLLVGSWLSSWSALYRSTRHAKVRVSPPLTGRAEWKPRPSDAGTM